MDSNNNGAGSGLSIWFFPCFIHRFLISVMAYIWLFVSFCTFSFGQCAVCPSSFTDSDYPLWYLQTLLPSRLIKGGIKAAITTTRSLTPTIFGWWSIKLITSDGYILITKQIVLRCGSRFWDWLNLMI